VPSDDPLLGKVREAVRAALTGGLFLGAGAWGVRFDRGVWRPDGTGRICPLGAALLGSDEGQMGWCPSYAFDRAFGLCRWASSASAGYDGRPEAANAEAWHWGVRLRADMPPLR
jgi:hypothetical protein